MGKIDYKKELKHLYKPTAKSANIVDVPKMNFLMIDGKGDPNTSKSFSEAIETLYPVSYTLKFMIKRGQIGIDYGVLPLEALWWADDMAVFSAGNKDQWKWTVMIMQPDFITKDMVHEATETVQKKKNPVALPLMRFQSFAEGKSAQIMHIGPFSEEGPTIDKLHTFIGNQNCHRRDKHHEIYLSDIRRAAPENWKTIIRQPTT